MCFMGEQVHNVEKLLHQQDLNYWNVNELEKGEHRFLHQRSLHSAFYNFPPPGWPEVSTLKRFWLKSHSWKNNHKFILLESMLHIIAMLWVYFNSLLWHVLVEMHDKGEKCKKNIKNAEHSKDACGNYGDVISWSRGCKASHAPRKEVDRLYGCWLFSLVAWSFFKLA